MEFIKWMKKEIKKHWDSQFLGELSNIEIKMLQEGLALSAEDKDFTTPIKILVSNIAAATSTGPLLGSAVRKNLKSVKALMDTSAAYVFRDMIYQTGTQNYISVSEAKDEFGDMIEDPLSKLAQPDIEGFGIAVDVVDGTTLATTGRDGSYSLSAAAFGLRVFPDLLAYAVGAPEEVMAKFNFYNNPEDEVTFLINNLCDYYNKKPSELKIVTHSCDTGFHHASLIEKMKEKGVQVIIPHPVIVESSYTLGMALRSPNEPDCLIGVFGLPEIVINTLLLAIIKNKYELRFRIASNSLLGKLDQKNLNEAFSFKEDEIEKMNLLNLTSDTVYSRESISSSLHNACFTATALTDDRFLNLHGYQKDRNEVILETLFSGYQGNTVLVRTWQQCINQISYPAVFPQPIDDLSLVLPVDSNEISSYIEDFMSDLEKSPVGSNLIFTPIRDLHVTLFEFGVHHGGYPLKSEIKTAVDGILKEMKFVRNEVRCDMLEPEINRDSIIFKVNVNKIDYGVFSNIDSDNEFLNVMKAPDKFHITIARFNKYLSNDEFDILSLLINQRRNTRNDCRSFYSKPTLVHITATPYTIGNAWSIG